MSNSPSSTVSTAARRTRTAGNRRSGLSEESLGIGRNQGLLLFLVRDPYRHDVGAGHASSLRFHPLEPDPGDAFPLALVEHGEGEPVFRFDGPGKSQGDPADIVLVGHASTLGQQRAPVGLSPWALFLSQT